MTEQLRLDEDFEFEAEQSITSLTQLPMQVKIRRIPSWALRVAVGVLAVAFVLTATWGYVTASDLGQTRTSLAAADANVSQLSTEVAGLRGDLAEQESRGDALDARVAALTDRVKDQDECIAAQSAGLGLLEQIHSIQVSINNLTAENSVAAKADDARTVAFSAAIDAYFEAYSAAWDGRYQAANNWIDEGNAQGSEAGRQTSIYNAEIDKVNELVGEVETVLDQYAAVDVTSCRTASSASST